MWIGYPLDPISICTYVRYRLDTIFLGLLSLITAELFFFSYIYLCYYPMSTHFLFRSKCPLEVPMRNKPLCVNIGRNASSAI